MFSKLRAWSELTSNNLCEASVETSTLLKGGTVRILQKRIKFTAKKFDVNAKWLFEVFGQNGTISKSKGKNNYEIIIEDVGVDVDAFTDKPQRIYQEVSLKKVVKKWDVLFSDSNPNAALNYRDLGGDSESTFVFEMKKPKWNKKSGEIKFAAKQHSSQIIDNLSMSGDLANHAHKSGDPISGKILNSSLFIDTAGDTVQFDKAKDGTMYPVLLAGVEGGFVLPANAPQQDFEIHPNVGWLTGQKMTVTQGSRDGYQVLDLRPGSLTGEVLLQDFYNQEWTKIGDKTVSCTELNSLDGCNPSQGFSELGYPNTQRFTYGGPKPAFGIWGADAEGEAVPLGITITDFG